MDSSALSPAGTASGFAPHGGGSAPARRAAWPQRVAAALTGSWIFWTLVVATSFGLPLVRSVMRQLPAAPPVLGEMPAFTLADEAGRPFGKESLRGRIVVAEIASPEAILRGSPLMQMQRRVRNTGDAVHLVSFVRNAPGAPIASAELAGIARAAHAGAWRWTFAAGDIAPFEAALSRSLPGVGTLDGKLLLIDKRGRVRRVLSPDPANVDLMMRDIGLLANLAEREPAPASRREETSTR